MPTFSTLEHITLPELTNVFNLAFSDYIIPLQLTAEQLHNKMITEDIDLTLSIGAFENNELIGFILHGCRMQDGKKALYNAGTGVIPAMRGKGLTLRLYDHFSALPSAGNVGSIQLEVITENIPAIKTYERAGFKTIRTLDSFKGQLNITAQTGDGYEIMQLEYPDLASCRSFWDWEPTWQHSEKTLEGQKELVWLGAYRNGHLSGYLVYKPASKRIMQFAVHKDHRRKGIGRRLFSHLASRYGADVTVINVDSSSEGTWAFLGAVGLKRFIGQYEMRQAGAVS